MLKKYKNSLFRIIINEGYDSNEFCPEEGNGQFSVPKDLPIIKVPKDDEIQLYNYEKIELEQRQFSFFRILIKGSDLNFTVLDELFDYNRFRYCFTDFSPIKFPSTSQYFSMPFTEVEEAFVSWLSTSAKPYFDEYYEPDLWSEVQTYRPIFDKSIIVDQNTSRFSEGEKEQMRVVIKEFKKLIVSEFRPNKQQLSDIDKRLSYLSSAIDRLNRFDWQSTAISTLIGISINLTLDTERGKHLWILFSQLVHQAQLLLQNH